MGGPTSPHFPLLLSRHLEHTGCGVRPWGRWGPYRGWSSTHLSQPQLSVCELGCVPLLPAPGAVDPVSNPSASPAQIRPPRVPPLQGYAPALTSLALLIPQTQGALALPLTLYPPALPSCWSLPDVSSRPTCIPLP